MIYIACSKSNNMASYEEQKELSGSLLRTGLLIEHDILFEKCEIIKNAWGKPFLKEHREIFFSVSHCSGGAALSLSACRTGIDIEKIRTFSMITARKVLADEELDNVIHSQFPERDFFRYWTLKESYTKAIGTGMSYPLKKVSFTFDRYSNVICNKAGCVFRILENNPDFVASVCYLTKESGLKEEVQYRLVQ